ncbi:phage tail tape measure protein [Microvirgula aerodenitrificans]|uniref:phage tail tape measure protein n=1 Tax=Microvirgula aerodenitrificans TaxID=57480 RepID=UPI0028E3A578|nr:phage tail tape measure protein [Microvirgula aerodenitrificans]
MDLIQFGIVLKAVDQMSGVFGSAAGKSIGAIGRLDQRMNAFSDRLDRLGSKAMGDGALLSGMMQKPIAAFADAEDASVGLKVAMLGAGGELDARFSKINKLATDLGDKLPGTTADFQNMMTELVKQGISYDAILGGVGKASAYLGVMLKKPPEQAAEFVAKMQDATGTVEGDMMGLMDTIQRATYLGVNDGNMLSFFTKMAPAMDTMRVKGAKAAQDMAPFAVMFDQMGMQGEAAGNALRKTVQLGMDTQKVAKANAGLAKKGIKLDFTDGKGEFGGMANLMFQLDKLKKLNKVDQLKALKSIFGDDAETLQVLAKLIEKGADGYNETVDKMARQADLQTRVNEQLGTLKNLWDAATGAFTNSLAAFGAQVAPELKAVTEWLGEASSQLTTFINEHPKLAKAAGLAAGGLGALLLVGGAVAVTLGTVSRLAGYALGPLAKLGGLFGKKGGAAGKAAEAAAGMEVQRVWVTNWPGGGFDGGGDGDRGGKKRKPGKGNAPSGNNRPGAPRSAGRGWLPRLAGCLKTAGRFVGRNAGGLLAVGASMYQAYDTYQNAKTSKDKGAGYGGAAGSLAGGLAGAKAGALIGALGGPIGMALGGLIGGAIGTFAGQKLGAYAGGKLAAGEPTPLTRTGTPPVTAPRAAGLGASAGPVPAPVPLNPAARQQAGATPPAGKTVVPQVNLTYNPSLIIQGDPIPGTAEKFKAMLNAHRDELLRLVNQAVENKARTAY